jgi:hypothetical protein
MFVQPYKIDSNRLIEHLRKKWKGHPCNMCGIGDWNVQDVAYELRQVSAAALALGGPLIPVIPVVCNNCGNTVLVNAITAGVMKSEQEVKP